MAWLDDYFTMACTFVMEGVQNQSFWQHWMCGLVVLFGTDEAKFSGNRKGVDCVLRQCLLRVAMSVGYWAAPRGRNRRRVYQQNYLSLMDVRCDDAGQETRIRDSRGDGAKE